MEGSLRHWFGSLTVVYDGDPHAPTAPGAKQACKHSSSGSGGTAVQQKQQQKTEATAAQQQPQADAGQQQPERYMFGFQPHGLYPTGALCCSHPATADVDSCLSMIRCLVHHQPSFSQLGCCCEAWHNMIRQLQAQLLCMVSQSCAACACCNMCCAVLCACRCWLPALDAFLHSVVQHQAHHAHSQCHLLPALHSGHCLLGGLQAGGWQAAGRN